MLSLYADKILLLTMCKQMVFIFFDEPKDIRSLLNSSKYIPFFCLHSTEISKLNKKIKLLVCVIIFLIFEKEFQLVLFSNSK